MNKRHPENLSIDILKPFLLPLRIEQKAGFLQFPFGSKEVIPKLKKYGASFFPKRYRNDLRNATPQFTVNCDLSICPIVLDGSWHPQSYCLGLVLHPCASARQESSHLVYWTLPFQKSKVKDRRFNLPPFYYYFFTLWPAKMLHYDKLKIATKQ